MPIHVRATKDDIAPYILLPGDPDRATYIAETFFDHPKCYTDYRKMYGYTGTYKGVPVSVQTTGMGISSTSIVVEELAMLGAKVLTRVGTCGAVQPEIEMADIILGTTAWATHATIEEMSGSNRYVPSADMNLVIDTAKVAREDHKIKLHMGPISTEMLFYCDTQSLYPGFADLGCLAVEMEAACIYTLAAKHKIKASCLLTASDLVVGKPENFKRASDEKIREGTDEMVRIALDTFVIQHQKD